MPGLSASSALRVCSLGLLSAAALLTACASKQPGKPAPPAALAESAEIPAPELRTRCEAKETRACAQLSRAYLRGSEVPRDLVKGVALARAACEAGDGLGCAVLGQAELAGFVPDVLPVAGLARCDKACESGSGFGCRCSATALAKGIGTPESFPRALVVGTKSCALGDAVGCAVAASAQVKIAKTWASPEARSLAKKGCELKDTWSCSIHGATIVLDPQTSPEERKAEAAKLEALCDTTEPTACLHLGAAHEKGLVGAGDGRARMIYFAQKACEKAPEEACAMSPPILLSGDASAQEIATAEALGKRGCAARDGASCYWQAKAAQARGDLAAAALAYGAGCALHETASCVGAAYLVSCSRDDWAACRRALTDACTPTVGNGCPGLARIHRIGGGGPKDLVAAREAAKRGCDLQFGGACVELAHAAREEHAAGWEQTVEAALSRGCKAQDAEACLMFGKGTLAGRPGDAAAASGHFADSCRLGDADGCGYHAALSLGLLLPAGTAPLPAAPDVSVPLSRATRACARGGGVGCWVIGRAASQEGEARPEAEKFAVDRFVDACIASPPFGCVDGAALLMKRKPVELDAARKLLDRGCQTGVDPASCAELAKLPPAAVPKGAKGTKGSPPKK